MRTISHSELNNFYASVECLRRPEIRDKPVAVAGIGIILISFGIACLLSLQTKKIALRELLVGE